MIETNNAGLDFRSIFTDANGTVLARAFNSGVIYEQTAPGVFTPSGVTLTGGTLNAQASVVMNGAGTEYIAVLDGAVSRWDPVGSSLSTVTLQGYGSVSGETSGSTQARGIAAFGNFWLTYNGAGIVSVWDTFGNRRANITLSGAGTSSSSDYSFWSCNGKVFIVDSPGGNVAGLRCRERRKSRDLWRAKHRLLEYGCAEQNTGNGPVRASGHQFQSMPAIPFQGSRIYNSMNRSLFIQMPHLTTPPIWAMRWRPT